jgi:hypothetical protein
MSEPVLIARTVLPPEERVENAGVAEIESRLQERLRVLGAEERELITRLRRILIEQARCRAALSGLGVQNGD